MSHWKKLVLIAVAALVIIAATGFWPNAVFYWKNFRGAKVFFEKPPEDIAKIINTTGMPLVLPAGFSISLFAKDLGNPRVMTWDPAGNLAVSIPDQGKVVALPDRNADGVADEVITVAQGLNRPHGLAVRCTERCQLFIAETDKVTVYDYEYDESRRLHFPVNGRKIIDLPGGGNHFTRTLLFMPEPNDHRLLISAGSSCNVCVEKDERRAKILISNADGSEPKEFARGLRNAVFMAIHPVTKKIWATEMGRDLLGDDLPPDEIDIVEAGKNYGWPICYGKNIHDTDFDPAPGQARYGAGKNPCAEFMPSYIDIPAHSAPLGLAFIPEEGWPQEYWYNLIVAYHGSWNRSVPTGYKVVRYKLNERGEYLDVDSTGSPQAEDFISGWLTDKGVLGRPVDILIQPGGIMYISDDKAGVIYRVTY
ncbi:MAG: PQQ-dependent sugar dehydrogenase, partial [Candidatus Sungiibacteriota bacterium]